MFLKLDWGIIWPIINIVVFYLLLRKFLFGPVSEVMEKRKKMISSDLDDAAQTKAEAEEIKQESVSYTHLDVYKRQQDCTGRYEKCYEICKDS